MLMQVHDAYFTGTTGEQRNPCTLDRLMLLRDVWALEWRGRFDMMPEWDVCHVAKQFTRFYVNSHQRHMRRWLPYLLEWRSVRVTFLQSKYHFIYAFTRRGTCTGSCWRLTRTTSVVDDRSRADKDENSERNANISVHVDDTHDRLDVQGVPDRDVTEPEEKRRRVDNPS